MPRKKSFSGKSEREWKEWGDEMGKKWADKWGDPDKWERRAHRGKIGFGLFLLIIGVFWLLKDMGFVPNLPLWPLILIFFALMLILTRM